MFRQLPNYLGVGTSGSIPSFFPAIAVTPGTDTTPAPAELFKRHPAEIAAYMEAYWGKARDHQTSPPSPTGTPDHRSDELPVFPVGTPTPIPPFLGAIRGLGPSGGAAHSEELWGHNPSFNPARPTVLPLQSVAGFLRWDHLIYAYMIENTRIYEIFRRVIHAFRHGEKLATPINSIAQNWLRVTEELFYSNQAPFSITNVSSFIRPDLGASRRNAYQRMFGMDLNHGMDDGKPYSYIKAEAANSNFVSILEELLREVWIGITFKGATSAPNPTDDPKIAILADQLHEMLQSRRKHGNLSREEFCFVSMMSWFHLTLEANAPILTSMRVEADGIDNKLFQLAERVGLPAHGLSRSFFEIADPMSRVLIFIEQTDFTSSNAPVFYDKTIPLPSGIPNDLPAAMGTIITNWTAITGRDVKARKVSAN